MFQLPFISKKQLVKIDQIKKDKQALSYHQQKVNEFLEIREYRITCHAAEGALVLTYAQGLLKRTQFEFEGPMTEHSFEAWKALIKSNESSIKSLGFLKNIDVKPVNIVRSK